MVLLEDEVLELNDATKYIVWGDGEAETRIDLLLGTQGWRRFCFAKQAEFLASQQDKVTSFSLSLSLAQGKRVVVVHQGEQRPRPEVRHREMPRGPRRKAKARGRGGGGRARGARMMAAEMVVEEEKEKEEEEDSSEGEDMLMMPPPCPNGAPPPPGAAVDDDVPMAPALDLNIVEAPLDAPAEPEPEPDFELKMDRADDDDEEEEMEMEREMAPIDEDRRQKKGKKRMVARGRRSLQQAPTEETVVFREYYHHAINAGRGTRTDFAEVLVFASMVTTDNDGNASVTFDLCDSVSSFRVIVDGRSLHGTLLGEGSHLFESREPFYIEPKMPLEVSAGDTISLPIALVNDSADALEGTITHSLAGQGLAIDAPEIRFELAARERARRLLALAVVDVPMCPDPVRASLTLAAKTATFSDTVTRTSAVAAHGFPYKLCASGRLESGATQPHNLIVVDAMIPGSVSTSVKIYPSPAASLGEALKSLLREPSGCFEQTSSTMYPLIMAQQYFKTHQGVDPRVIADAESKLLAGMKRLAGYECKEGGFEWFGGSPAHESLTAYGVLEFMDMSKVVKIDRKILERAQGWLKSRRDGKGGFKRNPRALDSFGGAPPDTTNAYIVYSLVAAGYSEAVGTGEIDALLAEAKKDKQCTYIHALAAATLYTVGRTDEAHALAQSLVGRQDGDGRVPEAKATITRSGGGARDTETTAISVLAWMHDMDHFIEPASKAMNWLSAQCKDGRFYSTQATILALKAIVQWDKQMAAEAQPGTVFVEVNGKRVAELEYRPSAENPDAMALPSFADALRMPGPYTIAVGMDGGFKMPYSVAVDFAATVGDTSPECAVSLSAALSDGILAEGEGGEVAVVLRSKQAEEGLPMTVAIIGLPGGLEPRHEQLKELVKGGTVSFYETRGREVVLYWRCLEPAAVKEFRIDVVATVPGTYTGPASRAYLYYTDELKYWTEPMSCKVKPK